MKDKDKTFFFTYFLFLGGTHAPVYLLKIRPGIKNWLLNGYIVKISFKKVKLNFVR